MQPLQRLESSISANGKLVVTAAGTVLAYQRPVFNTLMIELTGGENVFVRKLFFDLLDKEMGFDQRRFPRGPAQPGIEMFVDARHITRHGLMLEGWLQFLVNRRERLAQIHILATNKVTQLSVEIIRHLSNADCLVTLHKQPETFMTAVNALPLSSASPERYFRKTAERINACLRTVQQDAESTNCIKVHSARR